MKNSIKLLAVALLATVSTAAMADPLEGPYVGLGIGGDLPLRFSPTNTSGNWNYKLGISESLSGGYSFGNGIRAEAELGYLTSDVSKYRGASAGASGGTMKQFYYMANGLYDFDTLSLPLGLVPHLGAGVGAATLHQGSNPGTAASISHVGGTRLALQGIGGIEYPLAPGLNLGLDYRYIDVINAKASVGAAGGHGNFASHNLLLTMRYTFAPPAAAPAAPAPAPAPAVAKVEAQRAFQVFFDFDKSNITAEAAATIAKAASSVKSGNVTTINVTGHTDTVGSVKYNLALSQRRAAAVKQQLMADGIPASEIATTGVGKSGLLVPTPDGVREPQNRRAEIVLQ